MKIFSTFSGIGGLCIYREYDNMYIWIKYVLSVLKRNQPHYSIMTNVIKTVNTLAVNLVKKLPQIIQLLKGGVQSRDIILSIETEFVGATQG